MKPTVKPVALAVGAALAGSVMLAQAATASENPFSVNELNSGYMQPVFSYFSKDEDNTQPAAGHKDSEGKCGAGKCGGDMKKDAEGKCGAGKCGGDMKKDAEGKCGAGKCGGDMKKDAEGKCGAGKCGGDMKRHGEEKSGCHHDKEHSAT